MIKRKTLLRRSLMVLSAAMVLLWIASTAIKWSSCAWYGHQTERDTRYATFVGCMVKTPGGYVPRNELRTDSQ